MLEQTVLSPLGGRVWIPPPKAQGNGPWLCAEHRGGRASPHVLGSFGDFGPPHVLRLVLRAQPRFGGGSKMRPRPVRPPPAALAAGGRVEPFPLPSAGKRREISRLVRR